MVRRRRRRRELLASSIAHAEEIQSPISLCLALQQASTIDVVAGRHRGARERAVRCEDVASRYGLPFYVSLGRLAGAAAGAWLGDEGTVAVATAAVEQLMTNRSAMGTTLGLLQLAGCQAGAGQSVAAAATAQYGLHLARGVGERIFEVELALLAAAANGTGDAWADVARAAATADERGATASAAGRAAPSLTVRGEGRRVPRREEGARWPSSFCPVRCSTARICGSRTRSNRCS